MATVFRAEAVAEGIELWLLTRRDEVQNCDSRWNQIDELLTEARDAFSDGFMPWEDLDGNG